MFAWNPDEDCKCTRAIIVCLSYHMTLAIWRITAELLYASYMDENVHFLQDMNVGIMLVDAIIAMEEFG